MLKVIITIISLGPVQLDNKKDDEAKKAEKGCC
jgi:hypothetical protein